LLGEPHRDEGNDAADDEQRVQGEHRAHNASRVRGEARLPCSDQCLAGVLDVRVEVAAEAATTALGGGRLAGVAVASARTVAR
jgi:glycerol kinase